MSTSGVSKTKSGSASKDAEDLQRSINELRSEVKELRDVVNMLVEIIVNMEQDDQQDAENQFFPFDYNHQNLHLSI